MSENEPVALRALRWGGAVLTALWIGAGVIWMIAGDAVPAADPVHIGLALTGVMAPVALLWFMLAQVQRGADVRRHAEALRAELQALIFPTDDRAHRVGKDIERLCQQAAELAGASRAVVKAIARARQGMRTEIRDYAAITKKTEYHIDRLAGVLHDRAQKLNDLTGEIEQRTAVIDEKTQAGAEAWDHATLTVLERAGEMEAALGRGTDRVLHAADEVGGKIKASENRIGAAIENLQREGTRAATQLDGVGTAFDLRVKTLGGQADRITAGRRHFDKCYGPSIVGAAEHAHRRHDRDCGGEPFAGTAKSRRGTKYRQLARGIPGGCEPADGRHRADGDDPRVAGPADRPGGNAADEAGGRS